MKHCNGCDSDLPLTEFWRSVHQLDGLNNRCKPCGRAYHRNKWANTDPRRRMLRRLRQRYGLSAEAAEAMLEVRGNRCWCCDKPQQPGRWWAVDHDHSCCPGPKSCGQCVRGLLCTRCNTTLSVVEDVELMTRLKKYLEGCPYGRKLELN